MKNYRKIVAALFVSAAILTTGCTRSNTDGTNTNTDGTTNTTTNTDGTTNGTANTATNTDGTTNTTDSTTKKEAVITETEARQIALKRAGLDEATFTEQKYDAYDGEYEFEFYADDKEYDCDVNAIDGTITEYDEDIINQ